MHTGLDTPILMDSVSNISYIKTNTWTKIQESLKKINNQFKLEYNYTPISSQLNNRCIIQEFLKAKISTTTIRKIQPCRFYLQVTFFSKISNTKGDQIYTVAFQGYKNTLQEHATSTLTWPQQPWPNVARWKLCRKIIATVFLDHTESKLKQPLFGPWKPLNQQELNWNHTFSPSQQTVIIHDKQQTYALKRTTQ